MADDPKTVRICHVTDFHLPLQAPFSPTWLLSKRCLGFANLVFSRAKTHRIEPFRRLLEAAVSEETDAIVVTGDLSNLALESEYDTVDRELRRAGLSPGDPLIIPGNHDRYTPTADLGDAFERNLGPWLPEGFQRRSGYPLARRIGPAMLIGLDTTVWRGPVRAAGRFDRAQATRMVRLLEEARSDGLWPVIAMHHPPFALDGPRFENYRAGLDGLDLFLEATASFEATVLHGHLHRSMRRRAGGLDIIGAPSASNDFGSAPRQLAYQVYEIGAEGVASAQAVTLWPDGNDDTTFVREPLPEPSGARP